MDEAAFTPQRFALDWIEAVGRDDTKQVWRDMTTEFRLAMAQGWITHNPSVMDDPSVRRFDRDEFAELLSHAQPEHELFERMAQVSLRDMRGTYGGLSVDQLGPGTRPRPIGADMELVRLFYLSDLDRDEDGNYIFPDGAWARGASVLLTHEQGEGWSVAGIGDGLLRPGWPPTFEKIIEPAD